MSHTLHMLCWSSKMAAMMFNNKTALLLLCISLSLIYSVASLPSWPPQASINDEVFTSIDRIYLISSCHLDLGFADTLVNIVNRYFDEFFPAAIQLGRELLTENKEERLVFTTHSYLVWLYLNCPPYSGLNCPDNDNIYNFKEAIREGIIVWHAFPFNAQPEVYDKSMMDFGFQFTMNVSRDLGYIPSTMSQRDVPGLTRSVIPLMQAHGVDAITVGVNTACMPPAVPTAFVWKDETSNSEVIGMWHPHGYGYSKLGHLGLSDMVIVPGMNTALVFAIRSDNTGPPPADELFENYRYLRELFPYAEIVASGYNEFVSELMGHKDLLPVIKEEIGDTWIHGAGSDPWRTSQYREILRCRDNCLVTGSCSLDDQRVFNFSSFLLKYGEHTWGKDIKKYLKDTYNWTNEAFHLIRYVSPNYADVVDSWIEQRIWAIEYALEALDDHPLLEEIKTKLDELYFNGNLSMDGFESISCEDSVNSENISMSFNRKGMSIGSLVDKRGGGNAREYSGVGNPLAAVTYNAYTAEDYKTFLNEYLLDPSLDYAYQDLGKPGLTNTQDISDYVNLQSCWKKNDENNGKIIYRLRGIFSSSETTVYYGGSQEVVLDVAMPTETPPPSEPLSIELTLYVIQKTSTRIPESLSLLFKPNPQLVSPQTLSVSKLGEYVNVLDVITNGSKHVHGSDKGVKYGDPIPLKIVSLDTPILSIGGTNYFPVPMETPDVSEGFTFNIFNNLWGTNYIMWYPYMERGEDSGKYRFVMTLPSF